MLETFRKRDNAQSNARPQNNARPVGFAAPAARPPAAAPQTQIPDPVPQTTEANRPAAGNISVDINLAAPPSAGLEDEKTTTTSTTDSPGAARLTVGSDIKLKGTEITDCDTLIVEGQVEACMSSRVIDVAKRGIFRGSVQVDVAEIRGRFEGELTARKQLVIRAVGSVSGKIRYGKIVVHEGGDISGDVAAVDAVRADALVSIGVTPQSVRDADNAREVHAPHRPIPAVAMPSA